MLKRASLKIFIFLMLSTGIWAKHAVLVLGMHRSGTSVLTGILQRMGLYLGENLMPSSPTNPKGYFEHLEINGLNIKILEAFGSSWHDILPLKIPSIPLIHNSINEIKKAIKKNFDHVENFGLKDPRICLLLPYYLAALENLGYTPKLIVALRNPFEIAASLEKRDHISQENALKLTEKYLNSIESYINKYDSIILNFDKLVHEQENCIMKIYNFLPYLDASEITISTILEFIDKDLKHHNITKFEYNVSTFMRLYNYSL